MPESQLPKWSTHWVTFAGWPDVALAGVSLLLILLLIVWWRQQTRQWFRIATSLALLALLMCIASFYLFEAPAFHVSCPQGCLGWRGYPRAFATVDFDGVSVIAPLDFALNWLMLWLLWLVASVLWRIAALAFRWGERPLRTKVLFIFVVAVLPWALLPRFIEPPQPTPSGEALRLAINARRSAEFTYRITGLWVLQLALEDVRQMRPASEFDIDSANQVGSQVCLRGYTYFYLPWRRYRIDLDMSGVTALSLRQLSLDQPCWTQ